MFLSSQGSVIIISASASECHHCRDRLARLYRIVFFVGAMAPKKEAQPPAEKAKAKAKVLPAHAYPMTLVAPPLPHAATAAPPAAPPAKAPAPPPAAKATVPPPAKIVPPPAKVEAKAKEIVPPPAKVEAKAKEVPPVITVEATEVPPKTKMGPPPPAAKVEAKAKEVPVPAAEAAQPKLPTTQVGPRDPLLLPQPTIAAAGAPAPPVEVQHRFLDNDRLLVFVDSDCKCEMNAQMWTATLLHVSSRVLGATAN